MRTPRSISSLRAIALSLAVAPALLAQVPPILAPAKRTEQLDAARALMDSKPAPTVQTNPFFSETFYDVRRGGAGTGAMGSTETTPIATTPTGPRSNRDLLQAIATSIKPSGYFVIGGEPTLVFGQKRVKAGGLLTITFEGEEYTLEVSALDRTNFTLRLNREEFTRPIK